MVYRLVDFNTVKTVLDVGSGGGFPGIPLAMLFPTAHFVLVDSTEKKVTYLKNVIKESSLKKYDGSTVVCKY